MRRATAEFLAEEKGGAVAEDFTGRGMNGTTFGAVFESQPQAVRAIAQVAFDVGRAGSLDAEEILGDLQSIRWDILGLCVVVY